VLRFGGKMNEKLYNFLNICLIRNLFFQALTFIIALFQGGNDQAAGTASKNYVTVFFPTFFEIFKL